jgi:hypothetical protein
MALIHPINPVGPQPSAVDAVRRVQRSAEREREREREPRERPRAPSRQPPFESAVVADGHLYARV